MEQDKIRVNLEHIWETLGFGCVIYLTFTCNLLVVT